MPMTSDCSPLYVGRFAPSPSGPLHFGSLVTALASFLDARHHMGKWLVRIEDIDQPRCIDGIDSDILRTLECHGLTWDGEVLYQHREHERYKAKLTELLHHNLAYYCACTRKEIKAAGGHNSAYCRSRQLTKATPNTSIRLKLDATLGAFNDGIMGRVSPSSLTPEDVVIKRSDGLFSYNFVVALDDDYQGITHVVRGADLLDITPLQQRVYSVMHCHIPQYSHIPVASIEPGRKLSKQNHAAPVNNKQVLTNLFNALAFLGFSLKNCRDFTNAEQLLSWAITHWDRKLVPKIAEIIVDKGECTYYNQPF